MAKRYPVGHQMTEPYGNKPPFYHQTALLSRVSCGITCSSSETKLLPAHSTRQTPGLPLRTLSSSTCQRGKPTPGKPSSVSLGIGDMRQRATQVLVLAL